MGRPRKWASDAERMRAKRAGSEPPPEPVAPPPEKRPSEGLLEMSVDSLVDEQAIRDHYGYTNTETRTKAVRDLAADRMLGKAGVKPSLAVLGTRSAAIELGRQVGEDEANRRKETGQKRKLRIARAMHYAAWEWDQRHGEVKTRESYHEEFSYPL